jgi:hypothetical protein
MSRFGNTGARRGDQLRKQEGVMVIESRTIVGACAALAIVGGMLAGSVALMPSSTTDKRGQVEIQQVEERSWAVEVKDLSEVQKTAALTR